MRLIALFIFVFSLQNSQASTVEEFNNADPVEVITVENADILWIYSFVEGQLLLKNKANKIINTSIVQSGKIPVDISELAEGSYTLHLSNHTQNINRIIHFTKQ
jgi:predicted HNH restriction endonuclease